MAATPERTLPRPRTRVAPPAACVAGRWEDAGQALSGCAWRAWRRRGSSAGCERWQGHGTAAAAACSVPPRQPPTAPRSAAPCLLEVARQLHHARAALLPADADAAAERARATGATSATSATRRLGDQLNLRLQCWAARWPGVRAGGVRPAQGAAAKQGLAAATGRTPQQHARRRHRSGPAAAERPHAPANPSGRDTSGKQQRRGARPCLLSKPKRTSTCQTHACQASTRAPAWAARPAARCCSAASHAPHPPPARKSPQRCPRSGRCTQGGQAGSRRRWVQQASRAHKSMMQRLRPCSCHADSSSTTQLGPAALKAAPRALHFQRAAAPVVVVHRMPHQLAARGKQLLRRARGG